jgi:hypothetical protein
MPQAFNQNDHPFGQCGHFSQVGSFEKSRFFYIVLPLVLTLARLFSMSFHF